MNRKKTNENNGVNVRYTYLTICIYNEYGRPARIRIQSTTLPRYAGYLLVCSWNPGSMTMLPIEAIIPINFLSSGLHIEAHRCKLNCVLRPAHSHAWVNVFRIFSFLPASHFAFYCSCNSNVECFRFYRRYCQLASTISTHAATHTWYSYSYIMRKASNKWNENFGIGTKCKHFHRKFKHTTFVRINMRHSGHGREEEMGEWLRSQHSIWVNRNACDDTTKPKQ